MDDWIILFAEMKIQYVCIFIHFEELCRFNTATVVMRCYYM